MDSAFSATIPKMEGTDVAVNKDNGESKSLFAKLHSEEDDDESHLPPALRRKNRCHSSSSEDEKEDKPKPDNSDSSDSESDSEQKKKKQSLIADKPSKSPEAVPVKAEDAKPQENTEATRKDRDSSRSRSRSQSGSPSRRRRRKSSERSRGSRSRSRSTDRKHRREHKHRSHRSRSRDRRRSRDRDRDRDHHKRRRDHRRSRSRDRRDRRRGSRERRDRRDRRRSRDRGKKYRSRSRSPSRSPSPKSSKIIKFGDKVIKPGASFGRPVASSSSSSSSSKPMTFKEKMRQQLIKAMEEGADVSSALTNTDGKVICTQTAGTQQTGLLPTPTKPPVPLMANMVTATAGLSSSTVTASEAAMQSMLQLQKETTAKTGVEIPSYYNPGAINPVKYAEQVQKRKLLWSKNKEKDVNSQWHTSTLAGEHDDKSKEKFRKLMGIKDGGDSVEDSEQVQEQKQKEIFEHLDKEYQFARMTTHTHRGIGLGFSSASYPMVPTAQPPPQPPSSTG